MFLLLASWKKIMFSSLCEGLSFSVYHVTVMNPYRCYTPLLLVSLVTSISLHPPSSPRLLVLDLFPPIYLHIMIGNWIILLIGIPNSGPPVFTSHPLANPQLWIDSTAPFCSYFQDTECYWRKSHHSIDWIMVMISRVKGTLEEGMEEGEGASWTWAFSLRSGCLLSDMFCGGQVANTRDLWYPVTTSLSILSFLLHKEWLQIYFSFPVHPRLPHLLRGSELLHSGRCSLQWSAVPSSLSHPSSLFQLGPLPLH